MMRAKRNRRNRFPRPGLLAIALLLSLGVTGIAYGAWTDTIYIEGTIATGTWDVGATPGFWKNWDSHNTYTEEEIEGWLADIDDASHWLVPDVNGNCIIDTSDMEAVIIAGQGGTAEQKFLRQYLTTRLNVAAGRLSLGNTHNITGITGHGYLGLPDPASATLSAIIIAIEGKYPQDPAAPWPTDKQYEILKDVCDAINNLET